MPVEYVTMSAQRVIQDCISSNPEYGRGCESLSMHFIIWRSTKYRQHIQNPLIIDSIQVKNVYGVDVVGQHADTEVETLQKCLYWQTFRGCSHCHVILQRKSQRLPNLTTHTLNEACRKTAGTLSSPHGSLHMPIRAMIASRVEVFVEITAWMQLYRKEGLLQDDTV